MRPSLLGVLSLVLLAAMPGPAAADACPTPVLEDRCQLWVAFENGPGTEDDSAVALAVAPDGDRIFVTGYIVTEAAGTDYLTLAYDPSGQLLWKAQYDGPRADNDQPAQVSVSPDGGTVYVTGFSYGIGTLRDIATIAYDARTGEPRWISRFDGRLGEWDLARALAVSKDGTRLYVAGREGGPGDSGDFVIIAYETGDPAHLGEEVWIAGYDGGAGRDSAAAVALSSDGGALFVTGESAGAGTGDDFATVAFDPDTGQRLWVRRFDGPAGAEDVPTSVGVDPGGGSVFVTGRSEAPDTNLDYATLAYDGTTGAQEWVSRYAGLGFGPDEPAALAVTPDGSTVVVTGTSRGIAWSLGGGFREMATVAYETGSGTERWVSRHPITTLWGIGTAVASSPAGDVVYVAGQIQPLDERDAAVVAYDVGTGDQRWAGRLDSFDDGYPAALAVSPDGTRVYVTGSDWDRNQGGPLGSGNYRYATAAFDAS